jgi:tetratricopeptide (TPR) repeat protein
MKFKSIFASLTMQLLALSCAFVFSLAHADDYSDVTQLTKDGKYAEAIAKADAHILIKPRDPQMRFLKGVAQRDAGKTAEAIATFSRLTEDYPELPEPYNNLGVLYASQNQIDKARSAFEMAIRTNPTYSTAHENLGDVYAKLSSNAYNKALQLEGNNSALTPKLALIRQLVNPNTNPLKIVPAAPVPNAAAAAAPRVPGAAAPAAHTPAAPAVAPAATPTPTPAAPAQPKTPEPAPQTPASKPANDGTASKEAEAAVRAWANAWSAKDMKNYLGAYAKEFDTPGSMSRKEWEEDRRVRIESKAKITVKLDALKVEVNADKATVKFRQDYRADKLAVSSRKTLELVKRGDRWQIVRETVGG